MFGGNGNQNNGSLRCPKCKKYFVNVQAVFDVQQEPKKKGCGYVLFLLCGGFILEPLLMLFRRKKAVAKTRTYAVCQNCGYRWEIK